MIVSPGNGVKIEITKARTPDRSRRTSRIGSRKAGPLVELAIEISILAGGDIESRSGVGNDERIQHHFPPRQINRAEDRKAVSDIKRAAPKLADQIVRIHRKQRAALTIRVVRRLAQRVVAVELEHSAEPAVEADEELSLIELPTRFVTIDLTLGRIGPNTVRRQLRDRAGQRRIDVARANHVNDADVVKADEHRDVARQLSLDLRADHVNSRNLQIRIDLPDRLLRRRYTSNMTEQQSDSTDSERIDRGDVRQLLLGDASAAVFRSKGSVTCSLNHVDAIEAIRLKRGALIEPVVEEAGAEANHHLRRLRAVSGAGRPRNSDARCKVQLAVRVRLRLVAQTITERQVWSDAPIILNKHAVICLTDIGERISGVESERRCATAGRTNLRRRESLLLKLQRQLITLEYSSDQNHR